MSHCCGCVPSGPHMLRRYDSLGSSTISLRAFPPVSTWGGETITSVAPIPGTNAGAIIKGSWASNPADPPQNKIARIDDSGALMWEVVLPAGRISHEVIRASATEFVIGRARSYSTTGTHLEYIEWRSVVDGSLLRDHVIDISFYGGAGSWTRSKVADITANADLDVAYSRAYFLPGTLKARSDATGVMADGVTSIQTETVTRDTPADPSHVLKSMADVSGWGNQELCVCLMDDMSIAVSAALPRPSTGINPSFTTVGRTPTPIYAGALLAEGTNWEDPAGWGSGWGGKILTGDGTKNTLAVRYKGYGDPLSPDYAWGTLTGSRSPVTEPSDSLQLDFCNDRNGGACFGGADVYRRGSSGVLWTSSWYNPAYPLSNCNAVNVDDDGRLWAVGSPTE